MIVKVGFPQMESWIGTKKTQLTGQESQTPLKGGERNSQMVIGGEAGGSQSRKEESSHGKLEEMRGNALVLTIRN